MNTDPTSPPPDNHATVEDSVVIRGAGPWDPCSSVFLRFLIQFAAPAW